MAARPAAGAGAAGEFVLEQDDMIPLQPQQEFTVSDLVMDYAPPGTDGEDEKGFQVPDLQRSWTWNKNGKEDPEIMRKLIDSVIKNYPIPPIILNKCGRGLRVSFMIFDGRHRIETLWKFCNNEFAILNGGREFHFRDLPPHIQERILQKRISAIVTDNAHLH